MVETDFTHGPARPIKEEAYPDFRAASYVSGHANKIIRDLEKITRMYNGKQVRIFVPGVITRCTDCTDGITGAIMVSNCPTCNGTGKLGGYVHLADCWAMIDVIPKFNVTSGFGNADSSGGTKTPIVLINTPLLKDQSLIVTLLTKDVYKIVDVEPHIVAMQGTVITQMAQCNLISQGSEEYSVIDW